MDELNQGSVLYGLRSDRYPGIPCYGIVITASCDIANSKVSKIYCLIGVDAKQWFATVYKGNIIKNLIMDCQSYTKYRPNETTGGIFVSWRRKEELPTGA